MPRIVVVGNGATAVDASGACFVNRHTASFLGDLARQGHAVTYVELRSAFQPDDSLTDSALNRALVRPLPVSQRDVRVLVMALVELLRADFVYLFFPGTLSRTIARFCRVFGKPYGIYLRGERFSTDGTDGAILRDARFICSVVGMAGRVHNLNALVQSIRPMLDISRADVVTRDFLSRPPGPWRLLFVGRLERTKGLPELISAARALEADGFHFTLRIVGSGPLLSQLTADLRARPCSAVSLVGLVKDKKLLMSEYEAADLFIFPTHHEGFPRVLYEAMIKSVPIVTTFVGGIPGLMVDGVNSISIPVNNAAAISATILRLADAPSRLQVIADGGLSTVLQVLGSYPSHAAAVDKLLGTT